jgi:AraC-like DNA-binding protein
MSPKGERDCLTLSPLTRKGLGRCPEFHKEYQLLMISRTGGLRLTVADQEVVITGPSILMMAPGCKYKWVIEEEELSAEGVILRWPDDLLSEGLLGKKPMKGLGELLERSAQGLIFDVSGDLAGLVGEIGALAGRKGFDIYIGLLSLLGKLAVAEGRGLGMVMGAEAGEGERLIASAVLYMKENYSKPITLEEVAGKARMSRGAFCRCILKRTGKTYLESLNEIRMERVCEMLTGGTENIAEIAYKAGYNHVTYFNRWFKRQQGCTPKEYRERETPAVLRPAM